MHKEIIVNALVSLFIACIAYLYLDSKGTLEITGEYIKAANATGGIVSFVLAFFLIDRTYRYTLSLKPSRLTLTGNVSDEKDKGIFGTLIHVKGTSNQVSSNNVGFFSVEVDAKKDKWIIVAEHNDYEASSVTVTKNKPDDVAIILKKKLS
jgi:hypothetical protein